MKKLLILLFLFIQVTGLFSQGSRLPNVEVKALDGKLINARDIQKEGKLMVVSFWATWCKPCIKELNAIRDIYPDWLDQAEFQFVAVSVDDSRSQHSVAPFVKGRGWEYEVYLDINSDLKRALNVVNIPHTLIYNKEGRLVWQHTGYTVGDEDELFKKILDFSE